MAKESTAPDLVELMRRAIESGARGEVDEAMSIYGPDPVWDLSPTGLGTYRGLPAIRGLIEEGGEAISDEGALSDLGIIAAAQKVEHYEISAYGTAKAWAEKLGQEDVAKLLDQTLQEEEAADWKLTEVSSAVLESASTAAEQDEMERV